MFQCPAVSFKTVSLCVSTGQNLVVRRQYGPRESPVVYVASRAIGEGEELLVDYGEAYFKGDKVREAELV